MDEEVVPTQPGSARRPFARYCNLLLLLLLLFLLLPSPLPLLLSKQQSVTLGRQFNAQLTVCCLSTKLLSLQFVLISTDHHTRRACGPICYSAALLEYMVPGNLSHLRSGVRSDAVRQQQKHSSSGLCWNRGSTMYRISKICLSPCRTGSAGSNNTGLPARRRQYAGSAATWCVSGPLASACYVLSTNGAGRDQRPAPRRNRRRVHSHHSLPHRTSLHAECMVHAKICYVLIQGQITITLIVKQVKRAHPVATPGCHWCLEHQEKQPPGCTKMPAMRRFSISAHCFTSSGDSRHWDPGLQGRIHARCGGTTPRRTTRRGL